MHPEGHRWADAVDLLFRDPATSTEDDTVAINPEGDALERFLAEDPGGPVVMLNLLRYEPDGGREQYKEYAEHFRRTTAHVGAEVLYLGEGSTALVAEPGQAWETVLLVRYPSRQAFYDMVQDPAYKAGTHLRSGALVEAVLQATVPVVPRSKA